MPVGATGQRRLRPSLPSKATSVPGSTRYCTARWNHPRRPTVPKPLPSPVRAMSSSLLWARTLCSAERTAIAKDFACQDSKSSSSRNLLPRASQSCSLFSADAHKSFLVLPNNVPPSFRPGIQARKAVMPWPTSSTETCHRRPSSPSAIPTPKCTNPSATIAPRNPMLVCSGLSASA